MSREIPFPRAKITSLQFSRPEIRRISAKEVVFAKLVGKNQSLRDRMAHSEPFAFGEGGSGGGACFPVHQLVKILF